MPRSSTVAVTAAVLLSVCAPKISEAYVSTRLALPQLALRTPATSSMPMRMHKQTEHTQNPLALTRRALGTVGVLTAAAVGAAPQEVAADMLDLVTGQQKSGDFLARLKIGKVYLPTLKCNSSMPCWDRDDNMWYDFPGEEELDGFTTTPSGLKFKDLAVDPDLAELSRNAPSPNKVEGTNTVEVFITGYLVSPRYRTATDEAIGEFYDPKSKKSKYYDIRNRDPRMFQIGRVTLSLGKSKLIKGFEEGLSTMRVGMRRSIIIPPELGYGEKGSAQGTGFLKPIPANGELLYNIELLKILRG